MSESMFVNQPLTVPPLSSEASARLIIDEMFQFVGLLDSTGVMLDANQAAIEAGGLSRADVIGRPIWEAYWWNVSPETRSHLQDAVRRAAAGEFVRYEVEVYAGGAGSQLVWIDFSLKPVVDGNGVVRYLLPEGRNITEKVLAEAELERKNQELQELYRRVQEVDQLKSQFFANVSHDLRTPLTLILSPIEQWLSTGDLPEALRSDLAVVAHHAKNLLRQVSDLFDVAKLEAGKVESSRAMIDRAQQIMAHARDLERAHVEQRQSDDAFRQLADAMPQIVWATRANGATDYYNLRWFDYTGLSSEEMREKPAPYVVHDDDRGHVAAVWAQCLASGEPYEIECRLRRVDGVYRWHLNRALPVRDGAGHIVRWYGTCTDIHDQKRIEQELRESEQRKDTFLGIASHELRTPITSLKLTVQTAGRQIRRALADEPQPQLSETYLRQLLNHFERGDAALVRLNRLIEDMLDTSRIDAGKLLLRTESIDLVEVISAAIEEQQLAWPDRHLTSTLPHVAVPIEIDSDRVRQVVSNYIANAFKYSPATEAVKVSLHVTKREARIGVSDQGEGLTVEEQQQLFQRFSRVESISTQYGSGVGLGLGLYICRTIVERHGGQVGVTSEKGKGSTFWFTLPLRSA